MDSLLANYADDDADEEQEEQLSTTTTTAVAKPSLLSSLPQPKSSSLFLSLPKPKSQNLPTSQTPPKQPNLDQEDDEPKPIISNFFSSLPLPKSNLSTSQTLTPLSSSSSLNPNPKRVVQFKPPINPSFIISKEVDEDDEDFDNKTKPTKQSKFSNETSSVRSFLSSIPAPRNSAPAPLGSAPASGSGRRSVVETDMPASSSDGFREEIDVGIGLSSGSAAVDVVDGGLGQEVSGGGDDLQWGHVDESYGNYENYEYESKWVDRPLMTMEMVMPEMTAVPESAVKMGGKRGRTEVPVDIVEVKQDELIKNRPREDQVKLTGISFGPSYQPVSTKGKPTKLHKRKHQIGSLYYDMKQKEMELSERRSKGFLTKAETQAKYGW